LACGKEYDPQAERCPACGSEDRSVEVSDQLGPKLRLGLKLDVRHGQPGEVRPHIEKTQREEYARDRRQWELVARTFDREAATYVEEYTNLKTGEVVYRKDAPLDDQSVHGPRARAKRKRRDDEPPSDGRERE